MLNHLILFGLIGVNDPSAVTKAPLISERIEAKVGKEIITSSDLQVMTQALGSLHQDEKPEFIKKKALETLIDRALVRIYLKNFGVEITDRDLETRIQSIKASNGIQSNEDFKSMLASQGITFDQFKDQIRAQLENMQFMNVMRRQSDRTIEDKDLREYFQKHKGDFSESKEVELQECVLSTSSNFEEAQKKASYYQKNPKLFHECIKQSQSPSKENDGKIGQFQSGLLREDIEASVFSLKKGGVAVIPLNGAIQLLKVLDLKNKGPQSYEAVREKIRERLENEIIQKEIQRTLADLRTKTFIQI